MSLITIIFFGNCYCNICFIVEYSRLRKPWFRNFGNRHSGGWKLFDWLVYHLSGSAVLSSPEPLCGAVAGFTMPEYLIGFHQPTIDSAVPFWPDTTDMNAGIFIYLGIRTLFPECELMRVFQKYYLKELKLLRESGKLQYSGTLQKFQNHYIFKERCD